MRKIDEQRLFNLIKRQFFVNPDPKDRLPDYIGEIQAHISVLIGNMLEWYIRGSGYTPLKEALRTQFDRLQLATTQLAGEMEKETKKRHEGSQTVKNDDKSPFVIAEDWSLDKIILPFAQPPTFRGLRETLKIVDTDTGGAIRFNHHFVGELHPQGNILALAASIVATFLNENAVVPKVSPSVTTWEKKVVKWIWHMLDGRKPGECGCKYEPSDDSVGTAFECGVDVGGGRIVAGGTIANLTALFIAREKFHEWCKKARRRASEVRSVVLYSSHSHYSLKKAARIVGFNYHKDPKRSEIVPIHGRNYWYITADDVSRAIRDANARGQHVVMVSALGGATDTGFVDDLDGIAEVISQHNEGLHGAGPGIYYHVDAAMGGPFRLVSGLMWGGQQRYFKKTPVSMKLGKRRADESPLFKGIDHADAITIDGHKYFYCNYPCGGIFVRRESDFSYLHEDASYLESGESEEEEPEELQSFYRSLNLPESPLRDIESEWRDRRGLSTLEGSRSIIGITQLYCTLKVFGPDGIKVLLQHTLDMTEKLRELIRETKKQALSNSGQDGLALELITCGPLNQTLFRVVTNWAERTEPSQIDLDNKVNFLIPYYANWTQTGKLEEKLRGSQGNGNTAKEVTQLLGDLHSIPFYVGTDQLLGYLPDNKHERANLMDAFLNYVWLINGEASDELICPPEHKQNVRRWLMSVKESKKEKSKKRPFQVLKAVITHPYTDETVLKKFVRDICEGAKFIRKYIEKESGDSPSKPLSGSKAKVEQQ
jgi:glutamate/tyrosine decarboxylase-like PLP-dependent enzyme